MPRTSRLGAPPGTGGWRRWHIRWLPGPLLVALPAARLRERRGLLWYGYGRGLPRAWLILSESDLRLLLPLLIAAEEGAEQLAPCSFALLLAARFSAGSARAWLSCRSLAELEAVLQPALQIWQQRLTDLAGSGQEGPAFAGRKGRALEREKRLVRRPVQALARRLVGAGFPLTIRACSKGYQLCSRAITVDEGVEQLND